MLSRRKIREMTANLRSTLRRYHHQHFLTEHGHTNWKKIIILSSIAFVSAIVFVLILFATAIAVLSIGLPDVRDLDNLSVAQSTTIYDRENNVLYVKYGEENREYKKLSQISTNIVDATISIEDSDFYNHAGFNMVSLVRAGLNDLTGGNQQGGSTITQQYIKLTFLSSEKSITRKIKELILAVRLEDAYDKNTILEKYLNKIPYGNNAYGVEKAAQVYFNKHAKDLDLAESAILAGIPQAPTYYNPYGPNRYSRISTEITPEKLANRHITNESNLNQNEIKRGLIGQNVDVGDGQKVYIQGRSDLVLKRMVDTGHINEKQKNDALDEIHKKEFTAYHQSIKAPHFVFYIIQQLEDKYGKELVEQGGLKVYTTIDPKLQEFAEKAISDRSEGYQKKYNVKNSALVSLSPINGQILAMVGSRDYFDKTIDGQTNIATSFRQFGSTFKPIVYAAAFLNRYSPASIIFDVPTPFGANSPKNFDGKFQGPITLRKALGQSRNIPAIKTYFLAGEQKMILPFAKKLGVKFLDESPEYGYPMVLGTAETSLLSMTNAYATFANAGIHNEPVSILRVENAQGQVLEEWKDLPGDQALDPQVAYLISSILSDRSVNVGPNLNLDGQINAVKTGTSNRKNGSQYLPHDLLTIGYTTNLVTGVWAGNNDDTKDGPLNAGADGYNVAAPIFKAYMESALKDHPSEQFPIPEGIKQVAVSKYSGKLVSELTPIDQQVSDFFASFAVPTEIDDSYAGQPDFTASEKLSSETCHQGQIQNRYQAVLHDIDPTRDIWEKAAQDWITEHSADLTNQSATLKCSDLPAGEVAPQVTVTNLKDGELILSNNVPIAVQINSKDPITQVLFYLDNNLQYKQDIAPFTGNIRLPRNSSQTGHQLTVMAYDNLGRIGETTINLYTDKSSSPLTSTATPDVINSTTPPPL